ncbi:membrane transporter of cations and cationic drugs [Anaerolinea thermolimosa]|uniref:DMT family transporter n=1 Tax=Anaerolinea thermolimosa TaxID=229919 RepID=UPI000785F8E5|nr:hypothetical protein [Anaerolinea thermolimosa]GAP06600.1 membrane transporter of cations and cationic drugs [Anaerolinea thermolimosa]
MNQQPARIFLWMHQADKTALPLALVVGNMIFNVVANVCFKYSIQSTRIGEFLAWQVAGNLAGLVTVVTLTWLLKYLPLHIAFPLTTGLAVIGVHVLGGMLFFKEAISFTQWLGTLVIIVGIVLVTG